MWSLLKRLAGLFGGKKEDRVVDLGRPVASDHPDSDHLASENPEAPHPMPEGKAKGARQGEAAGCLSGDSEAWDTKNALDAQDAQDTGEEAGRKRRIGPKYVPFNISAPFIRRPVATTLLTIAIALAGSIAFTTLPVAPLPEMDFPVVVVRARLPGASPEIMATTVATPPRDHGNHGCNTP